MTETMKPLAQRAAARGLKFECRIAPETPQYVMGDPGRLRQILVNLVGNSVKFTDRGEIVVQVVVSRLSESEATLLFSVSDTGIGIAKDKQGVIFQPFVQADGSTTRKYGGTGLGLAICRHLVKLAGGEIWVEGDLGRGSVFNFTARFPLPAEVPVDIPVETLAHGANGESRRGLRVLMAEDNTANQKLVARLARKAGTRLSRWPMARRR